MPNFERAIKTAEDIRDALAAEVVVAREERVLIRTMNVAGLNARAAKRDGFNRRTADLQVALGTQLGEIALALGLPEATLEALHTQAPLFARRLSGVFVEVRALAAALRDLDGLNHKLGQRALSYVRAHLAVLCPKAAAYDRRGASAAGPRSSTVVRVL
jgi:hypothetical protein